MFCFAGVLTSDSFPVELLNLLVAYGVGDIRLKHIETEIDCNCVSEL